MSEPLRVLVADDNHVDRLLLSTIVRKEGYEVDLAVDGHEALAKFRACRPQLVLLDALMPGLDGFEVARVIKEEAGEDFIPVIFLTSLTQADALVRALDVGGDDFLSKPYNHIILKAKLHALQRMRALHTTLQQQRDELRRHHAHLVREQEAAKAVFDNVAHTGNLHASFIRHLISPLAIFNGDVLLAARNPSGNLYLLLGDFTGHGLTAAIGAMPLAEVFYGMTQKGFAPGEILREANRKLGSVLPKGNFCCAALAALNFHKSTLEFWNGGLPAACLVREGSGYVETMASNHLALGILADARFDAATSVMPMGVGDRLLLCTDGIVEARNAAGHAFGFERCLEVIAGPEASSPFEAVRSAIYEHIGGSGRDDDLTLLEVTMVAPDDVDLPDALGTPAGGATARAREGPADAGVQPDAEQWRLRFELGPSSLRSSNPLPLLQQILVAFPQLKRQAGAIYTALGELYSNALEHGLMGLDSSLKHSASGFARYYEARQQALAVLDGFVRFDFHCRVENGVGTLDVTVTDSGPGFDYAATMGAASGQSEHPYHGRGLRLLRSLCQSLTHRGRGNEVEVRFCWSDDDD